MNVKVMTALVHALGDREIERLISVCEQEQENRKAASLRGLQAALERRRAEARVA